MKEQMTGEQRVLGALHREQIDRIPTFEWLTSKHVIESLTPGADYHQFVEKMDIDSAVVELDFQKEWFDETTFRDEWGIVKKKTVEEYPTPVSGPITCMKDLDKYLPPDPKDPARYHTLEKALAFHQGKRAVIVRLNDVFSIPSRLLGFSEFMMAMIDEPELIEGLINMTVETQLAYAREVVKRGCKICFTGDDYAYNAGPMMSPSIFKKLFYPSLKRVMKGFKDAGLTVIKHSDGYLIPILDMIMQTDIDCIDPIDPTAGMDLAYMKKTYGDRFCIKGNVNCAGALSFGTKEEVINETKNCIQIAAQGGGYICSSSNSILASVKPENYKAMLDTIKEYGVYK